ncbi:hypothetical protein BV25DRAFT_1157480 [Artomyces pyxidatus]|uniref:Uncharacterized protein n=1 Tax=Artomyces pyxidatus TaxID=48021 RepID=A0ACB8SS72_9AGAM|nr:hypothetical protein BV25DRAFT_1157480 [Artomyces pyxidatus]
MQGYVNAILVSPESPPSTSVPREFLKNSAHLKSVFERNALPLMHAPELEGEAHPASSTVVATSTPSRMWTKLTARRSHLEPHFGDEFPQCERVWVQERTQSAPSFPPPSLPYLARPRWLELLRRCLGTTELRADCRVSPVAFGRSTEHPAKARRWLGKVSAACRLLNSRAWRSST